MRKSATTSARDIVAADSIGSTSDRRRLDRARRFGHPRSRMLVHPNFDPVAIQIGPLAIRWYGLMYLVGFAVSYWLGRLRIARGGAGRVTVALLDDLLFYGVLGVILGGRLGYVLFYKPGYYLQHPL